MLIVCEGVDNGGKTTLVEKLSELHRAMGGAVTVRHEGPPPPDANLVEYYERPLLEPELLRKIRSNRHLVLLDRHHVGETIYGPIYRGESRLSLAGAFHTDLLIQGLGGVRALVQPTRVYPVLRRYEAVGDDLLKPDHVERVYAEYEAYGEVFGWVRGSAYDDYGSLSPIGLLTLAEATTAVSQFVGDVPGYVGSHWPRVVLVGDQRSTGPGAVPAPWTTAAFTPMHDAASAAVLLRTMITARLTTDVGLLNANEPGQDLKVSWGLLRRPHLVALGNAASQRLITAELPHKKIVHPQYARRFMHHRFDEYVDTLKRATESAPDPSLVG